MSPPNINFEVNLTMEDWRGGEETNGKAEQEVSLCGRRLDYCGRREKCVECWTGKRYKERNGEKMAEAMQKHPRLILHNFLTLDQCKVDHHRHLLSPLEYVHLFFIIGYSWWCSLCAWGLVHCPPNKQELEFIHKSNSTVGYRPNVFSTTLSHLIATNCPHLLMPFVPIRGKQQKIKK